MVYMLEIVSMYAYIYTVYSIYLHLRGDYDRFARLHAQLDDLLLHVGQALHRDLHTYSIHSIRILDDE